MAKDNDYDMLGWTMLGLTMIGPVQGWDLWAEYVAPRIGVSPGNKDALPPQYRDFKRALSELADAGHIESKGKGRARVRLVWAVSEPGAKWWEDTGSDRHGPARLEPGGDAELPMKKWMGKGRLTRGQWRSIIQQVNAGTLEIALRGASDEDKRR